MQLRWKEAVGWVEARAHKRGHLPRIQAVKVHLSAGVLAHEIGTARRDHIVHPPLDLRLVVEDGRQVAHSLRHTVLQAVGSAGAIIEAFEHGVRCLDRTLGLLDRALPIAIGAG